MTSVRIIGLGPVLSCGLGVEPLVRSLAGENRALAEAEIASALAEFLSPARTRRLDPLGRMALLASYLAIRDAGATAEEARSEKWGIVFGTGFGPQFSTFSYLDGLIDSGDHLVSSLAFTNSVYNLPAAQISLALGVSGPVHTLSAFGATAGAAFQTACGWIRSGRTARVLLVLGEEASSVLTYAVDRMGGGSGPILPWGDRCTYDPRPGCLALLLSDGTGGYAGVLEVAEGLTTAEAADRAAASGLLCCAAAGRSDEADDYRIVASRCAGRVHAHAPLYGSLPTGLGMETAIAALALAGRTPEAATAANVRPRTAAVAGVCGPDRVTLISLEG
jgi:3-oxoacyl-[acyl-carrier-protein] synthase II